MLFSGNRRILMKKILLIFVILVGIGLLFSSTGICGEIGKVQTPAEKAGKGVSNIALGWTELPIQIVNKTKESGPITGVFAGIFEGAYKAVARTAAGVSQLATFPVGGYDRPKVMPDVHSKK
jgi:putative exosortase-associated protein (TIGR04073 family)